MSLFKPQNIIFYFRVFLSLSFAHLIADDPAPMQNFFPVVLVNNTGQPDTEVFFIGHGLDENLIPGFLVPDGNGIISFVTPDIQGTIGSAAQSRSFDQLPDATSIASIPAGATARLVYFPQNTSSRAYVSVQQPMYLETQLVNTGVVNVNDPSVAARNDVNYLTFYQDFEFGMIPSTTSSLTQVFLNLSYVAGFKFLTHQSVF